MFKTDITDEEVSEAANKLIKNYICNFYELKIEKIFKIINYSNICIYCGDHADKYIIDTNSLKIGYFCTKICKYIYYSIISSIFNLPSIYIINFIPYFLLTEESKIKYKNIKNKIKKYDNLSILSVYGDNNIISEFILLKDSKFIKYNEVFTYISTSKNCLYCMNDNINDNIILEYKNGIIKGFCSNICRDSISKQIFNTLLPIYKYNSYIAPFELIEDKKEFLSCIKI